MIERSRKVVFIGGTAFSGSTMLDMILANDAGGFSSGEVEALFFPFRRHHIVPACGCGESGCDVWSKVYRKGAKRLYASIFARFPETRFIVDSSKSPLWIRVNGRRLADQGIATRHILIWKSPEEFRRSCAKRGVEQGWRRAWVNYHRQYFRFVSSWKAIPYAELVSDPTALEAVCGWVGIPWFAGKEQYWRRDHHTLFGNTTAKIHLYNANSAAYQRSAAELRTTLAEHDEIGLRHRTIINPVPTPTEAAGDPEIADILRLLRAKDVRGANTEATSRDMERLAISPLYAVYRITRQQVETLPFRALAWWMR